MVSRSGSTQISETDTMHYLFFLIQEWYNLTSYILALYLQFWVLKFYKAKAKNLKKQVPKTVPTHRVLFQAKFLTLASSAMLVPLPALLQTLLRTLSSCFLPGPEQLACHKEHPNCRCHSRNCTIQQTMLVLQSIRMPPSQIWPPATQLRFIRDKS